MDLNQLLHAHQIAVSGQACAANRADRAGYADDIATLATRIRSLREDSGADVASAPFVMGEPIADYFER